MDEKHKQLNAKWPKCSKRNPKNNGRGTWDMSEPWERSAKVTDASRRSQTIHLARVCILAYEKGSELKADDPERKYKARTGLLGDNITDTWYQEAEMEGRGSAPPAVEDSRALDAFSLLPGYRATFADAESAYLQAYLNSKFETWVSIPREYWPADWHGKYTDPVCRLVLALYGHGDSGGYWEEKCYGEVEACGWKKIRRGVFWMEKLRAVLMIYVDDFKLVCHVKDEVKLWAALQERLVLDKPKVSMRFLGCNSRRFKAPLSSFQGRDGEHP